LPQERKGGTGIRREGRELALQLLYREEVTGIQDGPIPDLEEARDEALAFAIEIVEGVRELHAEIDRLVAAASEHWEISRMGAVDRTILRMGTYELLRVPDNPVGVVINEAVEIARKFSSDEGARFVNGVLDHVAREVRGERDPSPSRERGK
jgi:N utilization substance protein B